MNHRLSLSCFCLLVLVSLAAVPVLAATLSSTVTCPSSCSCLLPAEAKKMGYPGYCQGQQRVCAYDSQENEKYCYEKPATTSPQLIVTGYQFVTTTPTTITPQKCASGCTCLRLDDGKAKGLLYCGVRQTLCGYDKDKTPLYCFASPVTTTVTPVYNYTVPPAYCAYPCTCYNTTYANRSLLTRCGSWPCGYDENRNSMYCYKPNVVSVAGLERVTPVPTTTVPADSCGAGCRCLAADKADAAGFARCSGSSAPCGTDPSGRLKYCYVLNLVNPVVPASDGAPIDIPSLPPSDGPVPAVERKTTTPAPSDNAPPDLFASIGNFLASIFGGNRGPATAGPATGNLIACRPGTTLCGRNCTSLQSDDANCGACSIRCNFNERCCNGTCTKACTTTGSTGECATGCREGLFCYNRGCWGACPNSTVTCNRACVRIEFDSDNCGDCGVRCPENSHCLGGTCYGCGVGTIACGSGEMVRCVNTSTDVFNCGSCRHSCAENEICSNGSCLSCPAGTTACMTGGTARVCADLQSSEDHCGACRNACWFYGDNMNCISGVCRPLGYSVMEVVR